MPSWKLIHLGALLLISASTVHAQSLINGSFEVTSAPVGCNYNLSNAVFNSYYTDIEAFGGGNETDIIMDGCYVVDLPDGLRSISIAHVPEDEVSIPIDAPLTIGETYTLSFWALSETTFVGSGDVEIGLSTSATTFGTVIYTGSPTVMEWGNHTFTFVAPVAGTHITVRNAPGGPYWNHLDHFEFIVPIEELDVETTDATCFGACDGTATVTEGEDPPYTYLWSPGAGGGTDATATDLCAGAYTVEVTNGSGVVEVLDVVIAEPTELTGSITAQTDVTCFGLSDGTVTVEGAGGTGAYTFDIGAGPVDDGTFIDLPGGPHTVTIEDENGCTVDVLVDIIEPAELTLTEVTLTDVLCNGGDDGFIEVIGGGGIAPYEYSIDGAVFGPGATFGTLEADDYTLTVRDDNGCETTLDLTVTEPEPIVVDETVTGEICIDDCAGTITLDAAGGVAPFSYSIDDCATTDPAGGFTDLCSGDYTICVVDANGCVYNNVLNVAPGASPFDASIVAFGPLCINDDPVALDAVDVGVFTGPGVVGGSFDPAVAGVGTHTITNTIVDGCGAVATFDVTVNPLPNVSFMADVNSGCEPVQVTFTNTGDPGITCEWYLGDGSVSTFCGAATHTYDNAGTYDVSLVVTDANGCTSSAMYNDYIDVYEVPDANFVFDPSPATTLDTEVDFTDLSTFGDGWDWTFDAFGSSNDQNPTFTFPSQEGNYEITLIVVTNEGCRDTVTKILTVNQEQLIFVPNTITPDGDSFNEVFLPYFTGIDIYDFHMVIYNRWGEIMFETYDVTKGWNGTYGGEIVQDGVYVWHIVTSDIATDKKLEYHGHVTVVK